MSRPRATATRRRILESASQLFAEKGRGQTSVRDIAAAAGVNVALVSHHFGGKDKLYAACVEAMDDELAGLQQELLTALTEAGSLAETIERAVIHGFHFGREHHDAVRLVMRHVLDTGEVPQKRRDTLLLPFLELASKAMAGATPRSPEEIRLVVQSVMFLMTRYALSTSAELALVVGARQDEPEAVVLRRVETQLVRQAKWLFGLT